MEKVQSANSLALTTKELKELYTESLNRNTAR